MNNDRILSNLLGCMYRRWILADRAGDTARADREREAYLAMFPTIPV